MKKEFPLSKVYALLESGPVIMVSTAYKGKNNVMPMCWHTMIDFDPPLVGCVIGAQSRTSRTLKRTGECVLNIPTAELGPKVIACGEVSGAKTDKFKKFGLRHSRASLVKAPLLDDCYASLECELHDGKLAGKYDLFILKVVKAWVDAAVKNPRTMHHRGGDSFLLAGRPVSVRAAK